MTRNWHFFCVNEESQEPQVTVYAPERRTGKLFAEFDERDPDSGFSRGASSGCERVTAQTHRPAVDDFFRFRTTRLVEFYF